MDKLVAEKSVARPQAGGRSLLAGWILVVIGAIPLLIFAFVLIYAMLTTDFASGATFNLDIYSGLIVLIGTPSLIAILIGIGKIKFYQQQHSKSS